jgi:hypothetical protein
MNSISNNRSHRSSPHIKGEKNIKEKEVHQNFNQKTGSQQQSGTKKSFFHRGPLAIV